jgi:hypothetical protein
MGERQRPDGSTEKRFLGVPRKYWYGGLALVIACGIFF